MWHMDEGWGWWMVFGWIWMVAFWGIVIWAIWALVGRSDDRRRVNKSIPEPTAIEIAARRYANGEISAEEFESIRSRLERSTDADRRWNDTERPSG